MNIERLHSVVWIVYVVYALFNVYFILVLKRYIKLRTKECAQGMEQGLLTSERHPPTNQALDVYLQDAFAIDSDAENDRVCYSITGIESEREGYANYTADKSVKQNDHTQQYEFEQSEEQKTIARNLEESSESDSLSPI